MRSHRGAPPFSGLLPSSLAGLFVLIGLACSTPTDPALKGGILATFDVNGERYSIFIANTQTIQQVLDLWNGRASAHIPSGRVLEGRVSYNSRWSWHIDSQDITIAEAKIELCDGTPSYVEAHLDDWIANVGYFCPWSARLVGLKDYR